MGWPGCVRDFPAWNFVPVRPWLQHCKGNIRYEVLSISTLHFLLNFLIVFNISDFENYHFILIAVFCCPLWNDWLKKYINLTTSCSVRWKYLLLLHILKVLSLLEHFANKIHHFGQWPSVLACVLTVLKMWWKRNWSFWPIQCIVGYCYKYTRVTYDCFCAPGTHKCFLI